jgi:hypothetical protein
MNEEILEKEFNITPAQDHFLKLKSDLEKRTEQSRLHGQDKYMSSDDMYKHLNMLQQMIPRTV